MRGDRGSSSSSSRRGRGRGRGGGGNSRNRPTHSSPPPPPSRASRASRVNSYGQDHHHRHQCHNPSSSPPLPTRSAPYHRHRRSLSPIQEPNTRPPHPSSSPTLVSIQRQHRDRDYDLDLRRSEIGKNHITTTSSFVDQGFDFHHRYMLPDHHTDFSDVASLLKPPTSSLTTSQSIKDKGGVLLASSTSSSSIAHQMLLQKSMVLNDGSKRTFFSLHQHQSLPSNPTYDENVNVSSGGSSLHFGIPGYHDRFTANNPYDAIHKDRLYSTDNVSLLGIPPPPTQSRPFVAGASSSSIFSKRSSDFLGLYKADHSASVVGKFSDDSSLEYKGYSQRQQLSDPMRRTLQSPPAREERLEKYGYDEPRQRGRDDDDNVSLLQDDPYCKMVYSPRGEFTSAVGSSVLDLGGGRADTRVNSSHKTFGGQSSLWDLRRTLHRDTTVGFDDTKFVPHKDFDGSSGSAYVGYGLKTSREYDIPSYEESYGLGRVDAPVDYKERHGSPLLVDHPMFRRSSSSPRDPPRMDGDLEKYDLSPERMAGRRYIVSNGVDGRSVHRRIQLPSRGGRADQIWPNEGRRGFIKERRRLLPPKKLGIGHSKQRVSFCKPSRNDGWSQSTGSGGQRISLEKRLRPPLKRNEDFDRPHKFLKRGQEERDRSSLKVADRGDVLADSVQVKKNDPPEDSEEFKQQVHRAFLRFSKLLNESSHHQKMYRDDQKKSHNLLCCVCGRFSTEFVDVHSLLTHSYHSSKVGLRTEHMGFHKALCVLNDWNWLVDPDTGMEYKMSATLEIKTLREDLILWPPIVIIHNSSIGNKHKINGPRVVSIEGMEEILREMGFVAGKGRVCRGKPANQSVLLVKFMPTLSGLQEAERLHKYYADNNRGKHNFQQITSNDGADAQKQVVNDEELLYGYMAVAEDLEKLDAETKKRCLVKSKKDIEAIADAPLNAD